MELNSTVSGSWSSSSPDSVHLPGNPLETYTFTLSTSALIFTCLDTNVGDAFLVLRENNTVIRTNDHYYEGEYSTTACIRIELKAGMYSIGAVNTDGYGAFTLSLKDLPMATSSPITLGDTVEDAWTSTSGYTSRRGELSNLYTFTLTEETIINIDFTSEEGSSHVYLLDNHDHILEWTMDMGSPEVATITYKLEPGNYTIDVASSVYNEPFYGAHTHLV